MSYINHPLNHSHSKTTYSFSSTSFDAAQNKTISPRRALKQRQSRKQDKYSEVFKVAKQIQKLVLQMKEQREIHKLNRWQLEGKFIPRYLAQRQQQQNKINEKIKLKMNRPHTPTYNKKETYKTRTPSKINPKDQRYEDQEQTRTPSGYYPVGLQTHSSGKYIISQVRNVNSTFFGLPSPRPHQETKFMRERDSSPQFYSGFSQFGKSKY